MSKPILCVDFDGVIHSYTSGWSYPYEIKDPPVPGALHFLKDALVFFDVCIYSSRSKDKDAIKAMKNWLYRHAIELRMGRVDSWIDKIKFPTAKPSAFLTIDDRAFRFEGTFPDPEELLSFKPWNKK